MRSHLRRSRILSSPQVQVVSALFAALDWNIDLTVENHSLFLSKALQ